MGRRNRDRDEESEDSYGEEKEDVTWAGSAGFDTGDIVQKWRGTKKLCCLWPLYSESVTLTSTEIHVKRNECPALPRECRPFRGWAVAPLSRISAFYMRKTTTKPLDIFLLGVISIVVAIICGMAIAALLTSTAIDRVALNQQVFFYSIAFFILACCLGSLAHTLISPLRLVINVDGNADPEQFGIDLVPGKVQADDVKLAIVEAQQLLSH